MYFVDTSVPYSRQHRLQRLMKKRRVQCPRRIPWLSGRGLQRVRKLHPILETFTQPMCEINYTLLYLNNYLIPTWKVAHRSAWASNGRETTSSSDIVVILSAGALVLVYRGNEKIDSVNEFCKNSTVHKR